MIILPAALERLFSIFLICVFDKGDCLRGEPFHAPRDVLSLLTISLAFRPHVQVEERLNHVVMFLSKFILGLVKSIRSEHKIGEINLIPAFLLEDYLIVVENLHFKVPQMT